MLEPTISCPEDQWEEETTGVLPRRAPPIIKHIDFLPPPPAGISQAALNSFMGNLYMQELQPNIEENSNPIKMVEVANEVVHLITKETITKYKKLISDPLLQDDWMKGMCKESGRLSQGYEEEGTEDYVKGTHTVLFMNLDDIKTIPSDQVVTHARIVVDHPPQKKRPKSCENNCKGKFDQIPF